MSDLSYAYSPLPHIGNSKDIKQWVAENMVVVCDTREKENYHISGSIKQLGGQCVTETLRTADYAYRLRGELRTDLLIERKNSLTELSANITKYRARFENELERAKAMGSRLIILIEDNDFNDLICGKYQSKVNPQAFLATLFTYQTRYGVEVQGVKTPYVGRYIYNRFYYHVRELLLNA